MICKTHIVFEWHSDSQSGDHVAKHVTPSPTGDGECWESKALWNIQSICAKIVSKFWNNLKPLSTVTPAGQLGYPHMSIVLCSELMQRSPAQFQTHLLYQPVNNCDQHKLWRNCPTNIKRKILTLLKTASCDGEEQCASEKFFNTHEAVSAAQQKWIYKVKHPEKKILCLL